MKKLLLPAKKNKTHSIFLICICILFAAIISTATLSFSSEDRQIQSGINSTIRKYEPAVAVRASGCLTCHAEISSNYITDFGYGSPYFFANPASNNKVGIFNGNIYGDFIAGPGKTSWLTADFRKEIIVPMAPVGFNLEKAAGNTLKDKSSYNEALKARSLAQYLRALEKEKNNPAPVIEKKKVFIGAPDPETLEARFNIKSGDNIDFRYIKSDPDSSPGIKGIALDKSGNYYTNTGEVICDGDLFLRGMLLLNKPEINTSTGCRVYATGPVFLQKDISFKNPCKNNKSNLQLVSSEAIFLGVGRKNAIQQQRQILWRSGFLRPLPFLPFLHAPPIKIT